MTLISKAYYKLILSLAVIGGVLLAVVFVGIILDVTIRSIGFNSLQWYSAVAEYSLFFCTMFAAPYLVRHKGHVVVESLRLAMPGMVKAVVAKVVYAVCIILSLLFVYYGLLEVIDAIETGEEDLRSIDMPKWLLMIPFPIGFSLIAIEFLRYFLGFDTYYTDKVGSGESI
jgi:C4-dicarboxylate transporter DctQ subunit|tara:strand:+ start:1258 stop:1770 length:513 start_codon:yes stop_codon:yes gene_type:complete